MAKSSARGVTPSVGRWVRPAGIFAALDVTDPEPLPIGHPLWSAPNTIITPHVGGDSKAFEPRGRALVEAQLARFAAGQPLVNVVAEG